MGAIQFGVPRSLVVWLRDTAKIRTFVETGTNRAETAVWAAGVFDDVISVEAHEPLYRRAVELYGDRSNLRFLLGDSRKHMTEVARLACLPTMFWLDAHWCGEGTHGAAAECPILDEIIAINSGEGRHQGCPGHVILIDDARLFLQPPPAPHRGGRLARYRRGLQ